MSKAVLLGFLMSVLGFASISQAKVWTSTNTWDEAWEQKYSEWIKTSFNDDVFVRGPYADIATDCADAVYASRVIFSYENSLPFVIGSANSDTSKFDYIKSPTDRARAFIKYVGDVTSTRTLPNDTYPVQISQQTLVPGIVWVRASVASENFLVRLFSGANAPTGHTEVVKDVSPAGIIFLMGSTVPKKVRTLMTSTSLMFLPDKNAGTGFRRWIWPQNRNLAKEQMSAYSAEQYSMGLAQNNFQGGEVGSTQSTQRNINSFSSEVQARLAIAKETAPEYLTRISKEICSMLHVRNEIVVEGQKIKQQKNKCFSGDSYENFSTPSRDKRIFETIKAMLDASSSGFFQSTESRVAKVAEYFNSCTDIVLSNGETITAVQAVVAMGKKDNASDPNVNERGRWGVDGANNQKDCQ